MSASQSDVPAAAVAVDGQIARRGELGSVPLRERTARGTLVNGAFLVGVHGLGLLRGFVVAALLTRTEFGSWGMLVMTLGTLMALLRVGISDKYVQQDEDDQEAAFQKAFSLELAFSAIFLAALLIFMPLAVLAYGEPQLLAPGLVLLLTVPATALQAPLWIFYRRMQFARQRTLQAIEPVVALAVTVPLAVAGAGAWSLVIGAVVGAWAAAGAAVVASPYRLRLRFEWSGLREYAAFSWPVMLAVLSGVLVAQGSFVVAEAALGLAAVGALYLAISVSSYAQRVDDVVTQTLYPAICAVRDRADLLLESFLKSNRLALLWGIPFGVGLALFADDLIAFGIGERWRAAETLLQAFALMLAANQIGFNWKAFYQARGETRPFAVVAAVSVLATWGIAIPLLLTHGLDGFALGMGIVTGLLLAVRIAYLLRLFPGLPIMRHLARGALPTLPAAALLVAVRSGGGERSLGMALGELAAYVVVVVVMTAMTERALLREVLGYVRRQPTVQTT